MTTPVNIIQRLPAIREIQLPFRYSFHDHGYDWEILIAEVDPAIQVKTCGKGAVICASVFRDGQLHFHTECPSLYSLEGQLMSVEYLASMNPGPKRFIDFRFASLLPQLLRKPSIILFVGNRIEKPTTTTLTTANGSNSGCSLFCK